jgi:hypothetical protein
MPTMPFRQVHLDFHTSEQIPGVGSRFDGESTRRTPGASHRLSPHLLSEAAESGAGRRYCPRL